MKNDLQEKDYKDKSKYNMFQHTFMHKLYSAYVI